MAHLTYGTTLAVVPIMWRVWISKKMSLSALFVIVFAGSFSNHRSGITESSDPTFDLANSLYMSLTNGAPLLPENPLYSSVIAAVGAGHLDTAAKLITHPRTGAREFYDVMVASLPQQWNRDQNVVGDRNELSAMFLGYTRDEIPFKELLLRDWVYFDRSISNNDAYATNNPSHFRVVFSTKSPRDALSGDYRPGFGGVGIFTSYPWFQNYIDMGTNRRPIYGVLNHLYCTDIKHIQTLLIPDKFVKRDVPRTPAGNVNDYLSNCVGCHSFMDALIPRAFARYDTNPNNGMPIPLYTSPRDKNNEVNFAKEPITTDEWHLFVTAQQNAIFRFNGLAGRPLAAYGSTELRYMEGEGLRMFGELIANSDGFYNCMAKQVVSRIYLKKQFSLDNLTDEDKAELTAQESIIERFGQQLKRDQNLRSLIEAVAVYFVGGGA